MTHTHTHNHATGDRAWCCLPNNGDVIVVQKIGDSQHLEEIEVK